MSILVDSSTRVIVQGITGREGEFHTTQMLAYGTRVVGGVTPGKGGLTVQNVPVFDTVAEARAKTGANATCIFVPPRFAADGILEAAAAGIEFIVCITEGIPIEDEIRAVSVVNASGSRLLGPNCPGILTVGQCKIGITPSNIFIPGPIGIVSRSGTLTYEAVDALTRAGLGQTTCVGVGGDPMPGTRFIDVLPLFEADPETRAVVMCGEVGGSDEEVAAAYIATMTKPVIGFIAGLTAPPGKRMGHAGAIISGSSGGPQAKVDALRAAGVRVAASTGDIPALVKEALAG
ncbi:MAG: succinate--CoA ligase subunit alpha [Capsulimonadaceae bacterium]